VLGRSGGFLRSLRNYSRGAGKFFPESRLQQTAGLLLHALRGHGFWDLTGYAPLPSAPLSPEITGSPYSVLFFIPLLVPPCGGMDVYIEKVFRKSLLKPGNQVAGAASAV